jgi:hypothetical protein
VELGADLIGIFMPGAALAMRAGMFVAEKVGWLEKLERLAESPQEGMVPPGGGVEQSHIFEQYTNVMRALAEEQPLLLVLDDLQWADSASIGLLFHLGRRIGDSRILIVGTYRPGWPSSSATLGISASIWTWLGRPRAGGSWTSCWTANRTG